MKETLEETVKRVDRTLQVQKQSLKDHKIFFDTERIHIERRFDRIEEEDREISQMIRDLPSHKCESKNRIDDLRDSIMESDRSLKKLYIWMSGVGISILIFFLTLSVASIPFIDSKIYSVKQNTESVKQNTFSVQKIEKKLEKREEEETQMLKDTLREAFKDNMYYYDTRHRN